MIQVIFLDLDRDYTQDVCHSLNKHTELFHCSDLSFLHSFDDPNASPLSARSHDLSQFDLPWERCLILYHPDQFYNAPAHAFQILLTENFSVPLPFPSVFKYGSSVDLIQCITDYIQSNPMLTENSKNRNMICIAGNTCSSLRRRSIMKIIDEITVQGYKAVLMDLSPPYCSMSKYHSRSPYTLTDAILRVMAEDLTSQDIGLYITPDPATGDYYTFRSVEKTDDLYECTPDLLRKLMQLVIQWIESTKASYHVVINCAFVPFSFIYTISVLCDSLIIVNEDQHSNCSEIYERELSYLLSNLPTSCKVVKETLTCPNPSQTNTKKDDL